MWLFRDIKKSMLDPWNQGIDVRGCVGSIPEALLTQIRWHKAAGLRVAYGRNGARVTGAHGSACRFTNQEPNRTGRKPVPL